MRLYAIFRNLSRPEQQRSVHRMQTRSPPPGSLPIYSGPQRLHPRLPAVLAAALPRELEDFRDEAGLDS